MKPTRKYRQAVVWVILIQNSLKQEYPLLPVSKETVLEENAEDSEDYVSMCIIHFPNQK